MNFNLYITHQTRIETHAIALEQAMQDLSFDLESQSSDYFIGNINTYNSCRSCGSTPVRGHDYCYNCN